MVAILVHQLFVLDNIEIDNDPGQKVKRFREDPACFWRQYFLGREGRDLLRVLGLGHRGGRGDGRKSSSLGSKKKKKMGAESGQRGRHDAGDQEGQDRHNPGERHGKCWGVQGVGVAIGIFGGQTRLEVVKCENRDQNISLTYLLVVSVNISRIQGCLTFLLCLCHNHFIIKLFHFFLSVSGNYIQPQHTATPPYL